MSIADASDAPLVNVATRLSDFARRQPNQLAVVMPVRPRRGKRGYRSLTFRELDEDSNRIASGLFELGVPPNSRLILLVPPSLDFISLVFALFKARMVTVLIDPGMGRRNLVRCLAACNPDGFVGIPIAQAIRVLLARRFPQARHNVTVGSKWLWGGKGLDQVRQAGSPQSLPCLTQASDPAAIIFTTGSTGPPKGVLYSHRNFDRQVEEIRDRYGIAPGEVDLPGFPLFALFNSAMGVTTVIPDMDPTRPARVNPQRIVDTVRDWKVTQAFGSPAMWNTVGRYCEEKGLQLESLRRVLSAGAPVPPHVLRRMRATISPEGEIHTPYGATEALPVASLDATTVLEETAARTEIGQGYCVGHRFPGIQWRIIRIDDGPLPEINQVEVLEQGEIGELMVRGGVVTQGYVTRTEANALHKVADGTTFWHRMGDVGYLDQHDRFWFCGRKAHRVQTSQGVLYTIPYEAIFNAHPHVYRSALVGVGPVGQSRPVVFVEPWPEHWPRSRIARRELIESLLHRASEHPLTSSIRDIVLRRALPVDIRHNAKIFREKLALQAARRFRS